MYSGSAVVDHNNTAGFQTSDEKTLIAAYTITNPSEQGIAYSNDRGRTFTKLPEPVVGELYPKNRDPKVFWHTASEKWIMILWVKRGASEGTPEEKLGKVRFFTSDNMVDWEVASDFDREWVFECMDFVELFVGNPPRVTRNASLFF